MPLIEIVETDICAIEADVVVLKHADSFYGADAVVAAALSATTRQEELSQAVGKHVIVATNSHIAARHALFVGVGPLYAFDYGRIRSFASLALKTVASKLPSASHVAMTIHGVGYGLDERESFLAQLGGLLDASIGLSSIKRLSIVERDPSRARRLRSVLRDTIRVADQSDRSQQTTVLGEPIDAGLHSESKKHVFVAMPFAKDFEDTYVFGIQTPVNDMGFLCERVDMVVFTGDILDRIKKRIDSATLIVADLTGANANVYLEVGYAWGRNRPTLLIARSGNDLKFDVRGQRCIIYENIVDLSKKLRADIASMQQV
jgi:hypothetical protein